MLSEKVHTADTLVTINIGGILLPAYNAGTDLYTISANHTFTFDTANDEYEKMEIDKVTQSQEIPNSDIHKGVNNGHVNAATAITDI